MAETKTRKAASRKTTSKPATTVTQAPRRRAFESAKFHPTLGMLPTLFQDFNDELKRDLQALRVRSRDASINDPFARRYLKALVQNVVGSHGIKLKMAVKQPNGTADTVANQLIESRWNQFTKSVTVDGLNLRETLSLLTEMVARDGEAFVVLRKGVQFGKYLVQCQIFEAEHVDIAHNELAQNGNEIRQGIEYDYYGRVVAYHIWRRHPKSLAVKIESRNERIRFDAEDVIHIYDKERISQGRGFPWLSAALVSLKHINEYTKSELIASRIASAKMGFFTKPKGDTENIGDIQDETDPNSFIQEAQPGMFDVLPEGWQLQSFDPQNPNSNYSQFIKTILEGVAASLGLAYHTLSGDLSSANYSSLRQGALEERETFMITQQMLIDSFLTPLFEAFLTNLLAFQLEGVRLPIQKFDQFNAPVWRPRVWHWIDPAKEATALKIQLEQNLRSRTDVARSFGVEYVDVLQEIAAEQALAKELGVVIEPTSETGAPINPVQTTDEDEENDRTTLQ